MPPKYINQFSVDYNYALDFGEVSLAQDAKIAQSRLLISQNVRRFFPLDATVTDALKQAKISCNPAVTVTHWCLSASPKPEPDFEHAPFLYVDVHYDPMELEHIEIDKYVIGKMGIDLVEQALAKLEASDGFSDFPYDLIRNACAAFAERGYIYPHKVAEKTIPGTKIKGRIDLELSGAETKSFFSASYRGKPLMKTQFRTYPEPELAVSAQFHGFSLTDDKIVINDGPGKALAEEWNAPWLGSGGEIQINEHPELLAVMQEKGWLTTGKS